MAAGRHDGAVVPAGTPAWLLLAWLVVIAAPPASQGQVHHLEPLPWAAAADTSARRGTDVSWHHHLDPVTGWRADRLGMTLTYPLGARGVAFVRGGFWRLDTGDRRALSRWPHLLRTDEDAEGEPGWPGEQTVTGFDRPEVGILVPLRLPLLGAGGLGALAGLPVGRDELYPVSSPCLPLVFEWRRHWRPWPSVHLDLRGGREQTIASSRDVLVEEAFPSGWRYGVGVGSAPSAPRGLRLAWSARELADGLHSRRLELTAWAPLGGGHGLRLDLARELGGRAVRHAAWIVGLSWRLGGLPGDAPDAAPEDAPDTGPGDAPDAAPEDAPDARPDDGPDAAADDGQNATAPPDAPSR